MQQPPTLNALKFQYRQENIITMEDLLSILNVSPSVTVHEASADDFFDYDKLFSLYYADFRSKIKQNHIFACANEMSGNQLLVRLRESNLEEHPVTTHKVIKKGFYGCKNYATLMEAVNNRQKDMKALTKDLLENIVSEGLNAYMQVEMHAPAVANAAVAFSASAVVAVATAATAATAAVAVAIAVPIAVAAATTIAATTAVVDCYVFITPPLNFDGAGCRRHHP